ncbi:MAG: hypothetical protein IPG76_04310 [Acidobacteria bacterium]|nr:hypothetical protein [Acidobacteriota bacterium]
MSQREGIATFLSAVAPIVLGFLFSLTTSGAIRHPIAAPIFSTVCLLVGFALFLAAKIPQYRKGIYWSVGTREMTTREQKWQYRVGYGLMVFGGISWMGTLMGRVVSGH